MEQRRVLASYLRISLEDQDLKSGSQKAESNSISAQRQLIRGYIQSHPDLGAYRLREFLDDGYSGTTLNRPALQEMLALARNGRVHCVIVKDDCVIIEPTQKDLENQGFVAGSICF